MTTALDFPARRAAQLLSDVTMALVGVSPEEILEDWGVCGQIIFDAAAVVVEDRRYDLADAFVLGWAALTLSRYHGMETAILWEGVAEA